MDEKLKEIKALAELAFKQDARNFLLILRNLRRKVKAYKLVKDPALGEVCKRLLVADDPREAAALLDKLLTLLKERELRERAVSSSRLVEYYPEWLTISRESLSQIKEGIENERVRKKLRYLLENMGNENFMRENLHIYNKGVSDLQCLKSSVIGTVTLRILYFSESGKVRVCGFFFDHDEYERALKSGHFMKKNFSKERWLRVPRF